MTRLAEIIPARITDTTSRIATLDIERLPGRAKLEHRGLTIEGDFWDLNSWKGVIGRRIPPDAVTEWPSNITVSWRWYGDVEVQFAAAWEPGGSEAMHRRIWDVYNEADIVVGHNIDAFDTKKLAGEWWADYGLPRPDPFKSVDTLKVARQQFGFESNTLDALLKRLGAPGKLDRYDKQVARDAMAGDVEQQARLARYNAGDVEGTEWLYDRERGWITNHPHLGTHGEEKRCNQCGSDDLKLSAKRYRAIVLEFALYRCQHCGALVRGGWVARAATTRGVK